MQSTNNKSHNRNLEGLLYKQLNDLSEPEPELWAFQPYVNQGDVMCSLDYTATASFAMFSLGGVPSQHTIIVADGSIFYNDN